MIGIAHQTTDHLDIAFATDSTHARRCVPMNRETALNPLDASRTALGASLMRALHTRHDPVPLIDDDWGERLVPDAFRAALRQHIISSLPAAAQANAMASPAAMLARVVRANASYADVIVRARYAEDTLQAAIARGITQYVIIGAGFDSFAYRKPSWASGLAVYEIDHPATQGLKRQRLADCGVDAAAVVEFVAADLCAETLDSALARSSFQSSQLTFFSWLGVTMYLTREANLSALAAIGSCAAPGSELVFNYLDQEAFAPGAQLDEAFSRLKADVAAAGEAFLSGFDPALLGAQLQTAGLALLEDLNGLQAVARYDAAGLNGLRLGAAAHLAHAHVAAAE